jgi:hypothetical protein
METPSSRLTPELHQHLRTQIDKAVRNRTQAPAALLCPECGANTRDLPAPVAGCNTCLNRFWRRRSRSQR